MKKYILLISMLGLLGCGDTVNNTYVSEQQPPVASDVVDYSGFYYLENNSFIEIVKLSDGAYQAVNDNRLLTVNTNSSSALHPKLPTTPTYLKGGVLLFAYTASYNAANNNVQQDGTTTQLSGSRYTEVIVSKVNGSLVVDVAVYSATGNAVEVQRTLKAE